MTLRKIRLELARDQDFPAGSSAHGYEFTAPLNTLGKIDPGEWQAHRDQCRVYRFWEGEDDEIGHLIRKPGGNWAFHYDIHGDEDDDEAGHLFGEHVFTPGEYVSIREQNGELKTFRVVRVEGI